MKQVNQPRQPSSENVEEPPHAVFFSAGTQTDDVVLDVEEDRNEQEDQAIVAESLDWATAQMTEIQTTKIQGLTLCPRMTFSDDFLLAYCR